jgi:cobalamin biosynthesis Mg chelatase CobN
MAQAEQALADNPLVSDDLVQKVRELHELMAELMNEDLKRVLEEMHEALKKLGTDQFAQNLERARQAQQEFMDKLDRTIRMLRRAKLEAGLEVLRKYLEQLADRQAELAEQTRKLPEGRPANRETGRQRELADQTDPVAAQVAKLAEEMLEESEQIASELRNAAAELKQQDPAGPRGRRSRHCGMPPRRWPAPPRTSQQPTARPCQTPPAG